MPAIQLHQLLQLMNEENFRLKDDDGSGLGKDDDGSGLGPLPPERTLIF